MFSGTYESIWEVLETDEEGNEVMVDYSFQDFMAGIASVYQKNSTYILGELGVDFIKKIKFTGKTNSPKEYNFSTDTLDFDLTIDKKAMLHKLRELENDSEFDQYLKDHFTGYDGFWSFTPNNYIDLKAEILGVGREFDQAIGALITYLAKNLERGVGTSIEEMVYEDWQGNGYGGLSYTLATE